MLKELRDASQARAAAAERMRRRRERRKSGAVVIAIEVRPSALDDLAATGWLAPHDRADRAAVADAVIAVAIGALALGIRPSE
jgi:hypothetical protein